MRRPTRAVVRLAPAANNVVPLFSMEQIGQLSGVPYAGPDAGSTEMLYMPGESLYGAVANQMRALGWASYPQERDDKRMPSMVDKRAIKIGKYFDKPPTIAETRRWSIQATSANAAIFMGPASGDTFCIDVDITDMSKSQAVQRIAARILGTTPFQREGSSPKIALIYRYAAGEMPANKTYALADDAGAIEILSRGKAITGYGHHHKTGAYFKWFGGKPPVVYGPEYAPEVTAAQLQAFIDAVGEELGYVALPSSQITAAFSGEMASVEGWSIPSINITGTKLNIVGLIEDGREAWLKSLTFATMRQNPERLAIPLGGNRWQSNNVCIAAGVEVLVGVCRERMVLSDRFADGAPLRREIEDRLRRDVEKLERGEIRSLKPGKTAGGSVVATRKLVQKAVPAVDPALWHILQRDKRASLDFAAATMPDAVIAAARALQTDRTQVALRVADEIADVHSTYFGRVYATEPQALTVDVMASPAGSGKTTKTIVEIARDERTYAYDHLPIDQRPGPLLFILPTYNNIVELRQRAEFLNLDPSLSDDDLAEQAAERGLMTIDEATVEIANLRLKAKGTFLRTMVYKGKVAAGCHETMVPKVQKLSEAGLGSAGLCHARVAEDLPKGSPKGTPREYSDEYCPFYSTCGAIAQRADIANAHVVFLPHAFMGLTIPEELKKVRGVIADERIFPLFTHAAEFSLAALRRPRREPKLTKEEDAVGMTPEDILAQRDEAAWIASSALQAGNCPVAALAAHADKRPTKTITGLDLVKSAARVTGGASAATGVIHPNMSDWDLGVICDAPTGAEVREEYRFWAIIRDRLEAAAEGKTLPANYRKIQYRHYVAGGVDHEMIRISWMTTPNWPDAPVLLLDASAHEDIVQAIFPDREVVMHRIEADMNCRIVAVVDKRYSTSSLICKSDAELTTKAACAANIESIRDRLVFLSAVHANGRIVACASRAVRRAICASWTGPLNIDWIHFGAERGLNFAEKHVAAVVIGRMELPVWMYDGLACALASEGDDLQLLDPTGTGLDPAGERLKPTVDLVKIRQRDGADLSLLTARNPTGWLRVVQEQFREEGIIQALCRVRPVYREDTPTVYLFCQSIPESLIIDEICSGDDLKPSYQPLLEASRLAGGVIDYVWAADQRDDIATADQYKAMFKDLPDEFRAGFSVVTWVPEDLSRTVFAAVPAHIADPVRAVEAALQWAEIAHVGKPELKRQAVRVEPAGVRPIDDLVTEAGTFEERREAEFRGLVQAVDRLAAASLYVPAKGKHPAGAGDLAGIRMWLSTQALVHGIAEAKAEVPRTVLDQYLESEAIAI